NADVEMLLHISADHSNATIVSIPRDTMTRIPTCTTSANQVVSGYYGKITDSLAAGAGCTVDAVQQLTGVAINHFIQVDFTGVIALTNDVGGVRICVNSPVDDPYAHLNLQAGPNTVQGATALALLRSRHGFADGSDLYRTRVQHMYLAALLRKVE